MRSILDDVTYSATKAYSYRGGIIDAQAITSLTESSDLDELVTKLKATPYNAAVSRISTPYSARKIEKACVDTVTSGMMTKDLALLVGNNTQWLNTKEFIQKVKEKIN